MAKLVSLFAVLSFLFLAVGCANVSSTSPFDDGRLPAARYFIGGGWAIDYTASSSGILCVVDTASGKYLATKSMEAGENFQAQVDPNNEQLRSGCEAIGLIPNQMNVVLYFVPNEDLAEIQ